MLGDQDTKQGWEPEGPRNLVEKGTTQRHTKICKEAKKGKGPGKPRETLTSTNVLENAVTALGAKTKAPRIRMQVASCVVRYGVMCNTQA